MPGQGVGGVFGEPGARSGCWPGVLGARSGCWRGVQGARCQVSVLVGCLIRGQGV